MAEVGIVSERRMLLVDAEAARAGESALRARAAGLRSPVRSVRLHDDESAAAEFERLADDLTPAPDGDAIAVPVALRDLLDYANRLLRERDAAIAERDRLRAVLRGEDEAANEAAWTCDADSDEDRVNGAAILRAAGRAVGVGEE